MSSDNLPIEDTLGVLTQEGSVDVVAIDRRSVPEGIAVKKLVHDEDYETLVTRSTVVVNPMTHLPELLYLRVDPTHFAGLVPLLHQAKPSGITGRQSGIAGFTRVFGYMPRKKGRQDWCRGTRLQREHPQLHKGLEGVGDFIAGIYEEVRPDVFVDHMRQVQEGVPRHYHMTERQPFTSGIINYDFPIPYHYDAGNFPDTWNAMLTFKRDVDGGVTVFPEYGIALEVVDGSICLFPAQDVIHGVTPFRHRTREGYRITIVFYSLKQLCNCLSPKEELKRFRKLRTEHEQKRRHKA